MATIAQIDLTQEGVLFGLPMPMTLRPPVPLTDEEIIAFSRRNRPFRIERNAAGELDITSPVSLDGGQREAYAGRILGNWAEIHSGVVLSANMGFTLADTSVRSPDASWVSDASYQSLTPEERRRFAPICPEFLIEILSESDSRPKLEAKMQMWIDKGAHLAWMIDPFARTVSVYRPGSAVEVLSSPDAIEAGEPVAGFRLLMPQLWAQ
jgi:Uma2 family endonuclease